MSQVQINVRALETETEICLALNSCTDIKESYFFVTWLLRDHYTGVLLTEIQIELNAN